MSVAVGVQLLVRWKYQQMYVELVQRHMQSASSAETEKALLHPELSDGVHGAAASDTAQLPSHSHSACSTTYPRSRGKDTLPQQQEADSRAPDAAGTLLQACLYNSHREASSTAPRITVQPPNGCTLRQLRSLQRLLQDERPKYTAHYEHCKVTWGMLRIEG